MWCVSLTSTAHTDYIPGPYFITFGAGTVVNASMNVIILSDDELEDNERFNLILSSLSVSASVGDIDQATVTIVDDDGE